MYRIFVNGTQVGQWHSARWTITHATTLAEHNPSSRVTIGIAGSTALIVQHGTEGMK